MNLGNEDFHLMEALLEAGFDVKNVEIKRGKRVVTVEKAETKGIEPTGRFANDGIHKQGGNIV
jgi:hypothetical protein